MDKILGVEPVSRVGEIKTKSHVQQPSQPTRAICVDRQSDRLSTRLTGERDESASLTHL